MCGSRGSGDTVDGPGRCSPPLSGRLLCQGVSVSGAFVGTPASSASPSNTTCPAGSSSAAPGRRVQRAGAVRDHVDGHPGRSGQARLADHPGEQVLRRDLHRPQPEQLPVADAAPAGRAAHQLLRHRPLQHGQLHLAGVRPGPVLRRAGRLLDDGEHDQQQQRDHHDRHGRHRHRHRPHRPTARDEHQRARTRPAPTTATTASCWCTAASTPRSATTAASTRPTCRPCSTSSTPPASPGRPTPRTSAAPSPSARRPT